MSWIRARLRGQDVYARADDKGALVKAANGRVEIRYKPTDGRRYDARADNLEIVDATPLPDDTCAPAEAVKKDEKAKPAAGKARDGEVIAYADGACSGNPGPAGLGVVVVTGEGERVEISEYLGTATNNIAELTAVQRALEEVDPSRPLVVFTDSQYSIGVLQKGWKAKANQGLVADLRTALEAREATRLAYVPGHAGVALNERADALAREAVSTKKSRRATTQKP